MKAVMRSVSDGMFRHQLEGFEKYPRGRDSRFLEVFNEHLVSVDHGRAVVETFRDKMPTLQDIIDTALNLRPRFEVTVSQREQWEREYGPPEPFTIPGGVAAMARTEEREIDRLWRHVLAFLRARNFENTKRDIQFVPIGRCWQIARALGFEMNGHQSAEIRRYEETNPKSREFLPAKLTARAPITQADIDRVKAGGQEDRWD